MNPTFFIADPNTSKTTVDPDSWNVSIVTANMLPRVSFFFLISKFIIRFSIRFYLACVFLLHWLSSLPYSNSPCYCHILLWRMPLLHLYYLKSQVQRSRNNSRKLASCRQTAWILTRLFQRYHAYTRTCALETAQVKLQTENEINFSST